MRTAVDSNAQVAEGNRTRAVFFDFTLTLRTFLRSPPGINLSKKLSPLPAHILDEISELSKSGIKHMFPKHSFSHCAIVQIFHEDHIGCVTKVYVLA